MQRHDQLLILMALAGGGSFRTTAPTPHSLTNAEVILASLPIPIELKKEPDLAWLRTLFALQSDGCLWHLSREHTEDEANSPGMRD